MAYAIATGAPSLTQRLTRRAGPALPSYLALHHAGFSVPRVLPHERWALTPPFHPCQTKRAIRRRLAGFPARCHRAALRRRYILCGTVRDAPHRAGLNPAPHAEACNSALRQTLRGSPPGVTRRVALFLIDSGRCPDFPPVQPSRDGQTSDHPARPPVLLYLHILRMTAEIGASIHTSARWFGRRYCHLKRRLAFYTNGPVAEQDERQ